MKTATLVSIVLNSLIVITAPLALADTTKSQPGQMIKVLDDLKDRGFTIIKKIEFTDNNGTFKANALDTQGNDIEIQVNPVTGEMKKPTEGLGFSAREIAIKVQDAGFPNIAEISTQLQGNNYFITVFDEKGNKMSLTLDPKTGKVSKQ